VREKMVNRKLILAALLEKRELAKQHIDSYNDFIGHGLQEVINETKEIETDVGYNIVFGKISVGRPEIYEADGTRRIIYPFEARLRNLNYFAPIMLEMGLVRVYEDGTREPLPMEEVCIGQLPVMLRSRICNLTDDSGNVLSREELIKRGEDPLDPGGYFIVNGSERMLVIIEDLAPNKIILEKGERYSNVSELAKVFSKRGGFRALTTVQRKRDGSITVAFPSLPGEVHLITMMKALGMESDEDIVKSISEDAEIVEQLLENLEEAAEIASQEDALDAIGKKVAHGQTREYRLLRAAQVVDRYFLPHLGVEKEDRLRKAYYLAKMVERIFELAFERRREDDKDHYGNKRLRLAGNLMDDLFRISFYTLTKDMKYQLERQIVRGKEPSVHTAVRQDVLTERIRHALATGNWTGGRTGVSQLLDRTTFMAVVSHLRRVTSPLSRSQPHFEARDLHPTQFGRACPTETPEGPNCGLVKNLALGASFTTGIEDSAVEEAVYNLGVVPIRREK